MTDHEPCTGYLAASGYEAQLATELGDPAERHGRLFVVPGAARPAAWASNIWHDLRRLPIESIGHGAKTLRAIQRNWWLHSTEHHRRATLIQDKLPHVSAKPLEFPTPAPDAPLGSWTLVAPDRMLASSRCSSPFPDGEVVFVQDRESPPNRAYLKLFEALTLFGTLPAPGDVCLDLGSSPGGWTWVLQKTGAHVVSVDKAPLAPHIAALPEITFRQESAFGLDPRELSQVDWLFCDVACYPERLLELVKRWSDTCPRMVCTLKFQGDTDHEVATRFAALEHSRLLHLHHNKHELTWMRDASVSQA